MHDDQGSHHTPPLQESHPVLPLVSVGESVVKSAIFNTMTFLAETCKKSVTSAKNRYAKTDFTKTVTVNVKLISNTK